MEAHHPHHVTHKKKWTEYLLEFFMLFLAVFLGFVAENLREHQVEHRKAIGYMSSLVQDLKSDTASLSASIELSKQMIKKADTLIGFLQNSPSDSAVPELYRIDFQSFRIVTVRFEDRTASQLKNSGSMQFITNIKVADSIRSYWEEIKLLEWMGTR
ncbi:MAG: hypothetical protein ICV66_11640, partial [Chitinophagaceae bacterium]|nr:hypothetical protein [Chitinophagaceae bacterium]